MAFRAPGRARSALAHSESESLGGGERKEIITPWALLGEASRRHAQGCHSSYIEEYLRPPNLFPFSTLT